MSTFTSTRVNTKVGVMKPFCKVCQDAGKTEKEYTSHFVRSEPGPNGKVVCPTLLAQQCRYCLEAGHTAGYCPVIASNKKAEEKSLKLSARKEAVDKRDAENAVNAQEKKKKQSNVFAALDSDSESDNEVKVSNPLIRPKLTKTSTISQGVSAAKVVPSPSPKMPTKEEEFPALPSKTKKVVCMNTMTGYASAAAKRPEEHEAALYEQQLIANSMKRQMPPAIKTTKYVAHEEYPTSDSEDSWAEEVPVKIGRPVMSSCLLDWAAPVLDSDDEDW